MDVEEIKSSRGKTVLGLLVSLTFVAIFVAIPSEPAADSHKAWLGGGFFGLCSVVFACLLIRPQRLSLTPTGFTVSGGLIRSPKHVLWRDVDSFFEYRLPRGGTMVGYRFVPGARSDSALIRVSRSLGAEAALPKGSPESTEQLVERLNAYRARALAQEAGAGPHDCQQADPPSFT